MKGKFVVMIDELGRVRAQISSLREREKEIEKELRPELEKIALANPNAPHADGELFRATLVVQIRETLIAEKVRELLHPNTLRACTRATEVHSLRLTARSTAKLEVSNAQA